LASDGVSSIDAHIGAQYFADQSQNYDTYTPDLGAVSTDVLNEQGVCQRYRFVDDASSKIDSDLVPAIIG
jgi:hypothetical protein